jgi:hypothetical protein
MATGAPEPEMSAFLAERYWPGLDTATALNAVRRLAEQADDAGPAAAARIVTCAFVPQEQTVLVLIMAQSRDDVAEMGMRADLSFDRIVDAVVLPTARATVTDS